MLLCAPPHHAFFLGGGSSREKMKRNCLGKGRGWGGGGGKTVQRPPELPRDLNSFGKQYNTES